MGDADMEDDAVRRLQHLSDENGRMRRELEDLRTLSGGFDRVVERLRSRVSMNTETARLHPDLLTRVVAEARVRTYENALKDVLDVLAPILERTQPRRRVMDLSGRVMDLSDWEAEKVLMKHHHNIGNGVCSSCVHLLHHQCEGDGCACDCVHAFESRIASSSDQTRHGR